MRTVPVTLPLSEADVRALRVGDMVSIAGETVNTIGMPTHVRMVEHLRAGKPVPVDCAGGAFFHLSVYNRERPDGTFEALYMNPTTSTRFSGFMPEIIRALRPRLVGGKGGLDAECVRAMQDVGCAYVSFLGGGCTLFAEAIRGVVDVQWRDLIPQFRLVRLRVEGLVATVAIDANGNSAYADLRGAAVGRLPAILEELDAARAASKR